MKCIMPEHYLYHHGDQPDTTSECVTLQQVKDRVKNEPIKYKQDLPVVHADGKMYYAKATTSSH